MNMEKSLQILSKLCQYHKGIGGVSICYNDSTENYYVSAPFYIKKGIGLTGIVEHRKTIREAVETFMYQLSGKLLVFNPDSEHRKEVFVYSLESLSC